ncbi:MAG: ABC transporter ATP-binding protein [Thermoproteus sp. AZ2]|jgi:peptide/nickel transport system ATP-binding protein|uniref:ABC transporter ATP-binding protein n=1 Tax=Thermoproteus sp. AZ2 TaxID=1609232 RepID=A0ACC6V2D0_9CREN|nr:MAG: peptide ABC transporter ATP-binding protein [Vulcanisaeta sp. AZ3]
MLLSIRGLRVGYRTVMGVLNVLEDVNLDVDRGEIVGIVGESGSGKSTLGQAVARVLPGNAVASGEILVDGVNLLGLNEKEMEKYRGTTVFMVLQNPFTSLNPVKTVGYQLMEAARIRMARDGEGFDEGKAYEMALGALKDLRFPDPEVIMLRYPHQLSGGQIQRVVLAMSLILRPKILIADEPTSALDVTIQAQVINLFKDLSKEMGSAILFITHDISLAYVISTRIVVLYAGRVMEDGDVDAVIKEPMHPYTQGLIAGVPDLSKFAGGRAKLQSIPGNPPSFLDLPSGCKFHPRCPYAMDICRAEEPPLVKTGGRAVRCWLYGGR